MTQPNLYFKRSFESITPGSIVEFKIEGVDEKFMKLSGTFLEVVEEGAVFANLDGVASVKNKFAPQTPILVVSGNRVFVSTIIQLKSQRLVVQNPPKTVLKSRDKRRTKRLTCQISAILSLEQRGVIREKSVMMENISQYGCCLSINQTKEDLATGMSVGKEVTIIIEFKQTGKRLAMPGIIRNVRKDKLNENKKYAGIELINLSSETLETINAIVVKLEQLKMSR